MKIRADFHWLHSVVAALSKATGDSLVALTESKTMLFKRDLAIVIDHLLVVGSRYSQPLQPS